MNRYLFLAIFYLVFISGETLNAQNYLHESAKWYTVRGDYFDTWFKLEWNEVVGDTIIENIQYKKIQRTGTEIVTNRRLDSIKYQFTYSGLSFLRQ